MFKYKIIHDIQTDMFKLISVDSPNSTQPSVVTGWHYLFSHAMREFKMLAKHPENRIVEITAWDYF